MDGHPYTYGPNKYKDLAWWKELNFGGTISLRSTMKASSAFRNCSNLIDVTILNGVTSIGTSAFESCRNLTSITIPNSVTSIGYNVFSDCKSLEGIKEKGKILFIIATETVWLKLKAKRWWLDAKIAGYLLIVASWKSGIGLLRTVATLYIYYYSQLYYEYWRWLISWL